MRYAHHGDRTMEDETKFYIGLFVLALVLQCWLWSHLESKGWKPCMTTDDYEMCSPH